jgi:2-polyprenyl-6-methoxyphenol hydroxylase-like FAD-dependent oxidoreductase
MAEAAIAALERDVNSEPDRVHRTVTRETFDVIVAGGGMAGASAAAALSDLGYTVLLAEPGIDAGRRLAGELIHPPGAADLARLGLLSPLERAGGVPVEGFAVWADPVESRPGANALSVLPYADVSGLAPHGLALDHGAMMDALLGAVAERPRVSMWMGARVMALGLGDGDRVDVTLSRDRRDVVVWAQLLVAADGGSSHVRAMAGITSERTRLSTMAGFAVDGAPPCPGFAHVFAGPVPVLAYQFRPGAVRVMFDLRKEARGNAPSRVEPSHLAALPEPFRTAVHRAVDSRAPLVSASYSVIPEAVVKGRVVLVGDAAGCCHPLTATGLTVCTRDALRLSQALAERGGDIPAALSDYAKRRDGPQRTRLALAGALYETFASHSPEMRMLRRGLLRYWARSPRSRAVSMALLSTHESRMTVMAAEYARVAGYGLLELLRRHGAVRESLRFRGRALFGLSRSAMRYATAALAGLRAPR